MVSMKPIVSSPTKQGHKDAFKSPPFPLYPVACPMPTTPRSLASPDFLCSPPRPSSVLSYSILYTLEMESDKTHQNKEEGDFWENHIQCEVVIKDRHSRRIPSSEEEITGSSSTANGGKDRELTRLAAVALRGEAGDFQPTPHLAISAVVLQQQNKLRSP
ncbi:hypothetical protein OPV22_029957 [Ensete ventricosum]|uniref:Uncharacterized protein n=1 Tax=Ensete ventricosum TaxID=4639 RepID=A0AAV8QES5_ENSVE|nr:hypothetical protein OPV22_029957 [Ensete ventricosum]